MDTVDKGFGFLAFSYFTDQFSHSLVGQKHKILDEPVGFLLLLDIDAERFALFIELKFYLLAVEIDRSFPETIFTQLCRQLMQCHNFFGKFTLPGFDDSLDFFIIETTVRIDHRTAHPLLLNNSPFIEFKNRGIAKLILMRFKRAEVIGKLFWQHGDGTVYQVNGCSPVETFLIDKRSGFYIE